MGGLTIAMSVEIMHFGWSARNKSLLEIRRLFAATKIAQIHVRKSIGKEIDSQGKSEIIQFQLTIFSLIFEQATMDY